MIKKLGYCLLAALLTVITFGVYIRFHLVTVRLRTLGGVRAGGLGGKHVYTDTKGLVISSMTGKRRIPFAKIADTETGVLKVTVHATSGKGTKLDTWSTRTVAAFIGALVPAQAVSA